jgi:Fic family protein
MNLKLEFQFSNAEILKEVDELKKQIDAMRPLPADVEGRLMQKLRLDWNYHSNAIEGNRLNYGETVAFLMEGITAKGKPLKDHLDIRGHNEAINFLLEIVKDTRPISEADIRALHKMILVEPYDSPAQTSDGLPTTKRITLGEYKTSPNHVKTATGEIHYYATPEETPAKMQELMQWLEEVERYDNIHPVVIAAFFHHKFVEIHPFDDGNGRMSRILMNLILMQYGYPPVIVKLDDRTNYYSLLSRADNNDSWPFVEYIAERLQSSLQLYFKAAQGSDIDEDDDIDKEIALFKQELKGKINLTDKKSTQAVNNAINKSIKPLLQLIVTKSKEFDDLFFTTNKFLRYRFYKSNSPTSLRENILQNNILTKNSTMDIYESDRLEFFCGFKEFKQSNKIFDVEILLDVVFNSFTYSIYDSTTKLLEKYYHESISKQESKKIITALITSLTNKIRERL